MVTPLEPMLSIVPVLQVNNAIDRVKVLMEIVRQLKDTALVDTVDYGVIPGTGDKPTLLLPGMEKLMRALNAVPEYIEVAVIRDYDRPLFHYEYECRLIEADTGLPIPGGRGRGLCTSYESSFRWRWVQAHELPEGADITGLLKRGGRTSEFAFAIEKAETGGKYGKPQEYWQMFQRAIEQGTATAVRRKTSKGSEMDAWEIDTTVYRIENPDIFDQVNAIMKRGKKRALGDAVKGAANVSEFFNIDLEDLPRAHFGDVVEGTLVIEDEHKPVIDPLAFIRMTLRHDTGIEDMSDREMARLLDIPQLTADAIKGKYAGKTGKEIVQVALDNFAAEQPRPGEKPAQESAPAPDAPKSGDDHAAAQSDNPTESGPAAPPVSKGKGSRASMLQPPDDGPESEAN